DVRVVGGEAVAEGQREKNAEWRATLRLRVKQAGEEHRFCRRLAPPDCLAGTDQLGEIERFGRYGDRGFHAPLRADISSAIGLPRTARPRGAERTNPGRRRALAEERLQLAASHPVTSSAPPGPQHHAEENMPPHGHFDTPNQWWFTVKPVGSPMSVTSQLSPWGRPKHCITANWRECQRRKPHGRPLAHIARRARVTRLPLEPDF